jgi:O-antigen/teichoic acid export membrane protein
MRSVSKIFKNLVINFSSAIIVSLLSFTFTVIIARYLGSSSYGIFAYALSYITIFVAFNDFGFTMVAIREIAKDTSKTQKYFSSIFTLKLITSVVVFLIALIIVPILRKDPLQVRILMLFTTAGFIYMVQLSYRWIFMAHQVLEYEALLNIANGAISVLLLLLVIYLKKGLFVIAGMWIILQVLVSLIGLVTAHRIVKFRMALDIELLKTIVKPSLILGSIVLLSTLYLYLDKVILFQMKGAHEVGVYSAASKIMLFIRGIIYMYFPVAFPAFSSFSVNMNDRYFHKFLTRSFYYILILTSAIALGGTFLAPQVIGLVFGAGFVDAVPLLKILVWALPLTCLSGLMSFSFLGAGINKESLLIWMAGLVVNVLININFIGTYGYYATSIAVVVAELLMFTFFLIIAYKILDFRPSFVKLIQIASSLVCLAIFLLKFNSANLILSIAMGALLYFICLVIFRAINKDDWALLKKILLKQI